MRWSCGTRQLDHRLKMDLTRLVVEQHLHDSIRTGSIPLHLTDVVYVADVHALLQVLGKGVAVGVLPEVVVDLGILAELSIDPFHARPGLPRH
jgi:hypothetical protein